MNSLKRTLICFVLLLSSALLYAGVPSEFTYQGRIREAGQQKTGTYTMNFKIYSLATGGSSLWESGNQTIAVTNGMFSYRMAPTIDWRLQDLYLETVLNGTVLTPREKLTSHFFALHSGTAENISSTSTVTITLGSTPRLTIDTNGEVKNLMGGSTFYMVPRGGIIMWSGAIAAIPPGWGLCDGKWYDPTSITAGQSGLASSGGSYYVQTPDLTDRFILSVANSSENPGAIGNQNFRTITSDQLPAHSHNAYSGGASNDHTHAVGSTDLSHSHAMGHTHTLSGSGEGFQVGGTDIWRPYRQNSGVTGGASTINTDIYTGSGLGSHSHSLGGASADHTHAITVNDSGQTRGNSIDFRPAYFKLAFIMKL